MKKENIDRMKPRLDVKPTKEMDNDYFLERKNARFARRKMKIDLKNKRRSDNEQE